MRKSVYYFKKIIQLLNLQLMKRFKKLYLHVIQGQFKDYEIWSTNILVVFNEVCYLNFWVSCFSPFKFKQYSRRSLFKHFVIFMSNAMKWYKIISFSKGPSYNTIVFSTSIFCLIILLKIALFITCLPWHCPTTLCSAYRNL